MKHKKMLALLVFAILFFVAAHIIISTETEPTDQEVVSTKIIVPPKGEEGNPPPEGAYSIASEGQGSPIYTKEGTIWSGNKQSSTTPTALEGIK